MPTRQYHFFEHAPGSRRKLIFQDLTPIFSLPLPGRANRKGGFLFYQRPFINGKSYSFVYDIMPRATRTCMGAPRRAWIKIAVVVFLVL